MKRFPGEFTDTCHLFLFITMHPGSWGSSLWAVRWRSCGSFPPCRWMQVDAGGCADSGVHVCSSLWLPISFLLPVRRRQKFGSETTTWTDTVLLRAWKSNIQNTQLRLTTHKPTWIQTCRLRRDVKVTNRHVNEALPFTLRWRTGTRPMSCFFCRGLKSSLTPWMS